MKENHRYSHYGFGLKRIYKSPVEDCKGDTTHMKSPQISNGPKRSGWVPFNLNAYSAVCFNYSEYSSGFQPGKSSGLGYFHWSITYHLEKSESKVVASDKMTSENHLSIDYKLVISL